MKLVHYFILCVAMLGAFLVYAQDPPVVYETKLARSEVVHRDLLPSPEPRADSPTTTTTTTTTTTVPHHHHEPSEPSETLEPSGSADIASVDNAGVWTRLAQCESSGRWHRNDGTYSGGLQFHPDTWLAYGGAQYAQSAHQATPAEQIVIAQKVQASQGWDAWPACADELGLR